ncbi:MAG: hypothetical protein L0Y58_15925 [Verrucomicrobia subdivision 3 bacterium]|nr:hypothetical protein [Limisphaerales bacterium]
MKISKIGVSACGMALGVLLAIAYAPSAPGAEAKTGKGGASDLMTKKPIQTAADIAAVKPGDTVAMACPKCKTVHVTQVVKENKPGQSYTVGVERHTCPGCGHVTEVKGHGKMATQKAVHVCSNCGSKNAFCCVLKEGAGPTKGMEQEGKKP